MNTNTLSVSLAVLALSGLLLSEPASAVSECQQQQRNFRVYMVAASIKLEACVSDPGPICIEAINGLQDLEESFGADQERLKECFPELRRTDPGKSQSLADELIDFMALLGKVGRIVDRAVKKGHF